MKILLSFLALILAALVGAANYTTQRFLADYVVAKDRMVAVTESIDVTFTIPQHGLIRKIPMRVKGSRGGVRQVEFTLEGVETDSGSGYKEERARAYEEGGDWKIRIGDPDVEHSGAVRYRIRYSIRGALTDIDKQGDPMGPRTELFWNVIPAHWDTGIDHSGGSVTFPTPAQGDLAARLVIGNAGSRHGVEIHRNGKVVGGNPALKASFASDTKLEFTVTTPIESNVGVTVVLGLPKGTVDLAPQGGPEVPVTGQYGGNRPERAQPPLEIPSNPMGYLLPLLVVPIVYLLARPHFAPKMGPLTVRFEPPDGLGASECGLLIDHTVDSRDIVAGMVALAQKGAAKMHHPPEGVQGVTIELLPLQSANNVTPFEEELYHALEPFGPVITPDLLRGQFYPHYNGLVAVLNEEAMQNGWYSRGAPMSSGCGCFLTLGLAVAAFMLFAFVGWPIVLGAIVAWIGGQIILGRTSNLLPLGGKLRAQCLGLKEFITRANDRELNYMANRMPDQAMFEELLPFAVAFDTVQQWTKAFEGLNIQPPEWYSGYDGTDTFWTYLLLSDLMSMQNDYGQAVSYPDTSSFGSGGGFGDNDSGFGGGFSGGSDSGSTWDSGGSFDSGGSVDSGGGGGGGDSW